MKNIFFGLVALIFVAFAAPVNANPFIWTSGDAKKQEAMLHSIDREDTNQWWLGTQNWSGATFTSLDVTCGPKLGRGCGTSMAISFRVPDGAKWCHIAVSADVMRFAYVEVIGLDANNSFVEGSNIEFGGPKHGVQNDFFVEESFALHPLAKKVLLLVTPTATVPSGGNPQGGANVEGAQQFLRCVK